MGATIVFVLRVSFSSKRATLMLLQHRKCKKAESINGSTAAGGLPTLPKLLCFCMKDTSGGDEVVRMILGVIVISNA